MPGIPWFSNATVRMTFNGHRYAWVIQRHLLNFVLYITVWLFHSILSHVSNLSSFSCLSNTFSLPLAFIVLLPRLSTYSRKHIALLRKLAICLSSLLGFGRGFRLLICRAVIYIVVLSSRNHLVVVVSHTETRTCDRLRRPTSSDPSIGIVPKLNTTFVVLECGRRIILLEMEAKLHLLPAFVYDWSSDCRALPL